jgi:hypothetical protein
LPARVVSIGQGLTTAAAERDFQLQRTVSVGE